MTEPIRPQGMKLLQKEVELVIAPDRSEETILDLIGEFDGVITRTTKITREMMERSARLKVIGRHGAGLDLVDMDAASEHGICVVHTPGANARSVAEFVVAMMLALSRYLIPADYAQRVERQFKRRDQFLGHDLQNKTLGIIGMGRVGREVAKICRGGFDMRILGFDPWVTKEDLASIGAEKVETVEDILKNSDFVSLNCPLTADNRGFD
ncbi:MAG: NAD(P)-dependent oxidoreductase [bacterium]